jgi:hypothetical protein
VQLTGRLLVAITVTVFAAVALYLIFLDGENTQVKDRQDRGQGRPSSSIFVAKAQRMPWGVRVLVS